MSIRFAQIEPTTRCNFTCGFCAGRKMSQGDLTLEAFRTILELNPDLEHVELQGEGEPLLHKELVPMIELARERNILVSLITNASLFTPKLIDAFLRLEVTSIHCSLESAGPELFRQIRGGKFEKLQAGVQELVTERNKRGLKFPAIGLAVTVLKKTMSEMPEILEFYHATKLDGGIFVQPLQKMAPYISVYDDEMKAQLLDHDDLLNHKKNMRELAGLHSILRRKKSISAFYRGLAQSVQKGESGCPWLLHGTYISYTGHVMPCCTVKDTSRFSFGILGETPSSEIESARLRMNKQLVAGDVPTPCEACGIGNRFQPNLSSQQA